MFRFHPAAQELFIAWLHNLEQKVRGENDLHPAFVSHLSKYRSLMPALALLFELADRASGIEGDWDGSSNEVSIQHAQQAAAFCEYLESHASRVYSCVTTPQMRAARDLASKIKEGKVDPVFTCRKVYLKNWSGLDTPEVVKLACNVLCDAGWIREIDAEPGQGGGRPTSRYQANPRIWK